MVKELSMCRLLDFAVTRASSVLGGQRRFLVICEEKMRTTRSMDSRCSYIDF